MTRKYKDQNKTIETIIKQKEPEGNMIFSGVFIHLTFCYLALWLLFQLGIFKSNKILIHSVLLSSTVISLILGVACKKTGGRSRCFKWLFILFFVMILFGLNLLTGFKTWMAYAIPIILSCRYFNRRLTIATGAASCLAAILSAFANAYLHKWLIIFDVNMVSYSKETNLAVDGWLFAAINNKGIEIPLVLRNSLLLSALPNIVIMVITTFVCISMMKHNLNMLIYAEEISREKAELELKNEKSRARIMLSQIQPHFLYNSLSAIMGIEGNPDETVEAVGNFGKYLRQNLDTLSMEAISFKKEMEHVAHYLNLEYLRFADRIHVHYDITVSSFAIPPLSVQVLVENAVKHGISERPEGGNLCISTREEGDEILIDVIDDGVGFDVNQELDTSVHVGLDLVALRLQQYNRGRLEIHSQIGKGTKATIHLKKR